MWKPGGKVIESHVDDSHILIASESLSPTEYCVDADLKTDKVKTHSVDIGEDIHLSEEGFKIPERIARDLCHKCGERLVDDYDFVGNIQTVIRPYIEYLIREIAPKILAECKSESEDGVSDSINALLVDMMDGTTTEAEYHSCGK